MSTTSSAFLPAVFGACIVIGLIGMAYALIPAPPKPPRPTRTVTPFGRLGSRFGRLDRRTRLLVIGGAVTGLLVALLTGWVIATVLVPAAIIGIPLLLTPLSRGERRKHAAAALRIVGLEDRADHYPRQLSGGQEQRVSIARALANDPVLLLADEPTGNLDAHSAEEVLELMQSLNEQFGTTVIMVTHDPKAARSAKRLLHLEKGTFVQADIDALEAAR